MIARAIIVSRCCGGVGRIEHAVAEYRQVHLCDGRHEQQGRDLTGVDAGKVVSA